MQPRRGLPPNVMPMLSEDPRYPTNPTNPIGMRQAIMQSVQNPPPGSGVGSSVAEILSQGSPGQPMPDLGGATSAASRQRQIADMLMQGAQQQDNRSIAGGISQLGQAFLARRAGQKADTAETERERITRDLLATATGGGPDAAAARAQLESGNVEGTLARYDTQQAAQAEQQRTQMQNEMLANLFPEGSQERAMLLAGVGTTEAAKQAFAPPPEPPTYASAIDSTGVRKYTEGPEIGQPVPGFEDPRPDRGGMQVSLDENGNPVVTFGGPLGGLGYGSAPKGQEAAIAFDEQGKPIVTPGPQQQEYNKAKNFLRGKNRSINIVRDDIARARELVKDPNATGPIGVVGRSLPVVGAITPGGRLASRIKTIKTNIGFDKLAEMRETSPTGGALGNVSNIEIDFLQSVAGELDNAQTDEDVDYVLQRIDNFYAELQMQYEDAFSTDFPSLAATAQLRAGANQQVKDLSAASDDELLNIITGGQ